MLDRSTRALDTTHFCASMLIADNKDIKTIQQRLGHVDAAMTLNVYGHLIKERQAKARERSLRLGGSMRWAPSRRTTLCDPPPRHGSGVVVPLAHQSLRTTLVKCYS